MARVSKPALPTWSCLRCCCSSAWLETRDEAGRLDREHGRAQPLENALGRVADDEPGEAATGRGFAWGGPRAPGPHPGGPLIAIPEHDHNQLRVLYTLSEQSTNPLDPHAADAVFEHYRRIGEALSIPIMIYNIRQANKEPGGR